MINDTEKSPITSHGRSVMKEKEKRSTHRKTEDTIKKSLSHSHSFISTARNHIIIMRSSTTTYCTILVLLALSLLPTVSGFGGSNVFGLFRRRRLRLLDEQMEREEEAANKGFAGPHGEPLSGDEVVDQKQLLGVLDPFLGWFRNTNENGNL